MNQVLTLPKPVEIRRMVDLLRPYPGMRDMYEEAAESLARSGAREGDFVLDYQRRNFPFIHRGFERITEELYGTPEKLSQRLAQKVIEIANRYAAIRTHNAIPRGTLRASVIMKGVEYDLGVISVNVVTTAYVNFLTDKHHTAGDVNIFKYHASGTNNTAENASDTALGVEVEASRIVGNQTEGASANIYHTEGQIPYTATRTITEHGVFSAAAAGTLLDRSIFTGIPVDTATEILFKYEITFTAGG